MKVKFVLLCLYFYLCGCGFANSSNILGFFPVPFPSYQIFVKPLLAELAERGHNITIYTMFTDEYPVKYRQIDIKPCIPSIPEAPVGKRMHRFPVLSILYYFRYIIPKSSEIFECAPLAGLVNSTDRYDLFLTNINHNDWYTGFAYKFKAPMINIFPNKPIILFTNTIGASQHPGYVPSFNSNVPPKMSFRERLINTFVYLVMVIVGPYFTVVPSQKLSDEVFGDGIPPLEEIVKNTSMTFINTHLPYHVPMPTPPNVMQVGGMNIGGAQKLPEVCNHVFF